MRTTSGSISGRLPLPEQRPRLASLATVHWGVLAAALALAAAGVFAVRSASEEAGADYFARQLVWSALGLVGLLLAFGFDYHRLLGLAPLFYGASLLALVAVLLVGHEAGGAVGWFRIGSVGIQPSEFAKLATALMLARYLASLAEKRLGNRHILVVLAIAAAPMLLTAVEPDLGGAAMIVPMVAGMLLVAGVRPRLLVGSAAAAILVAGLVWNFGMKDYQRQRVLTFLAPAHDPLGAGYQVRQSKIAVGSGQLSGRGYGQGTQSQLRFLPARHTDFILAVIAEEAGFLGVAGVLGLYAAYLASCATVATRARDRAGILLVTGLASTFAFHVVYNSAMVIGLVPVTGIPLPFLSYGGSFTLANWVSVGLVLGVDFRRYVNR
ncbi:MAG: mrdB [Acidobacteria bacterium]|jgi:rod shape determining protein RodA|nr:mrdB [Acidobacteriota bacterium]